MKKPVLTLIIALFISTGVSRADVIDWGFEIVQTPTNSFDSTGGALDSNYTFYIGGFDDGFTATSSNYSDWLVNWSSLDSAVFDDGANNWFTGSENLNNNLIFDAGDQAFIWGTNGALGSNGEVILLTAASWNFPSADVSDPTVTEFLLTAADLTAVVGAVNFTDPEIGNIHIQTEAVPEPSGVILFGIGLISLLFRRRTRQTA